MIFDSRHSTPSFPRRELFRLMSMLMLLALVGMLVYRSRDPSMWRWIADDVREETSSSDDGNSASKADETQFWLELIGESGLVPAARLELLRREAAELTAIMAASRKTASSSPLVSTPSPHRAVT